MVEWVEEKHRKGAKTKMFGAGLLFLGALNSMLSWRGGFAVSGFSASLLAVGVVLLVVGAIRAGQNEKSISEN